MKKRNAGFTLVELLIVVGVIALLVALLAPALQSARGKAYQITCSNNLKQIGIGIFTYANDYNEYVPIIYIGVEPDWAWNGILDNHGYVSFKKLNRGSGGGWCPVKSQTGKPRYGMNQRVELQPGRTIKLSMIGNPSLVVLLTENRGNAEVSPWYVLPSEFAVDPRHGGAANYLLFDSHGQSSNNPFAMKWQL